MIAEAGLAALWLAASMALLQAAMGFLAIGRRREDLAGAIIPTALLQAALVLLAFGCLVAVFVRTDLSVLLVVENSHPAEPMLYKVAGTWGNHEGSMLLWVTILGLAGAAIALFERKLREDTKVATLATQGVIALGFYAFLLFSSNPFARIAGVSVLGGLNPLLQDPGLAFHPPTLYVGYVGMSAAFSFAVGALVTRNVGPDFARAMRPWVLGAWIFLTIGITAGLLLGLLHAWLGRMVVLGPGRERIANAVAGGDRAAPFGDRAGDARRAARMDDHALSACLLDVDGRHFPRPLRYPHQRA